MARLEAANPPLLPHLDARGVTQVVTSCITQTGRRQGWNQHLRLNNSKSGSSRGSATVQLVMILIIKPNSESVWPCCIFNNFNSAQLLQSCFPPGQPSIHWVETS